VAVVLVEAPIDLRIPVSWRLFYRPGDPDLCWGTDFLLA